MDREGIGCTRGGDKMDGQRYTPGVQESSCVGVYRFSLHSFTARVNSVLFYLLWTCAPIFVSIISFMTYVMRGNQLTISTAFTVRRSLSAFLKVISMLTPILPHSQAIALFNMVRAPLNVIPAWIVQILQVSHFSPL